MSKQRYKFVKVPVAWRGPSYADKVCELADGDTDMALDMWRISNIALARKCIDVIPQSQAARRLMIAARRGEIPLCNTLLNGDSQ